MVPFVISYSISEIKSGDKRKNPTTRVAADDEACYGKLLPAVKPVGTFEALDEHICMLSLAKLFRIVTLLSDSPLSLDVSA
jgi:hypothetical protein